MKGCVTSCRATFLLIIPAVWRGELNEGRASQDKGARGAGRGLVRRGLHFLPDRIDKGHRGIGWDQLSSHL